MQARTRRSRVRTHAFVFVLSLLLLNCDGVRRDVLLGRLKAYRLPTSSMEPTIHTGEYAFARPLSDSSVIRRGEVIVFKYPLQPKTAFCKRVIGLPGDTVEIRHKEAIVNGKPMSEPYAVHSDKTEYSQPGLPEPYRSRDNLDPVSIAPGHYFVLGDSRDQSSDSRYWGNVPRASVTGEVVAAGPAAGPFRPVH